MKINRNVMIHKAGGNASKNAVCYRIALPIEVIKFLGITKEDRAVSLEIVGDHVEIKKASKD